MSIQSTAASISKTSSASSHTSAASKSSITASSSSASFQDELQTVSSNPSETTDKTSSQEEANTNVAQQVTDENVSKSDVSTGDVSKNTQTEDSKTQNVQNQTDKTAKATTEDAKTENNKTDKIQSLYAGEISKNSNPYDELNSELKSINAMKNQAESAQKENQNLQAYKVGGILNQTGETEKTDKAKSGLIGLDMKDMSFYMGMIDNQQMKLTSDTLNANNASGAVGEMGNASYKLVQSATGESVKVSSTLMNALSDSMQNNKSVRVDFGGDVSVVMKLDRNGAISANFIPSTAIAEAYLKNNISSLRQNFDNQNISYNNLSYSEQENKGQQERQKQNNNKEKDNE